MKIPVQSRQCSDNFSDSTSIIMMELVAFQGATSAVDWVIEQKTVGVRERIKMETVLVTGMITGKGETKDASSVEATIIS